MIDGVRFGAGNDLCRQHYVEYLADRGLETPTQLEAFYGHNPCRQSQEMYALHTGALEHSIESMVNAHATDLLESLNCKREADGHPFFLWVNYWGPHTPCLLPEPYYSMYDPAKIPVEPSFGETWRDKPRVHELYERFWGLSPGGWESWRKIVARYWGYVTMIDELIGQLTNKLRELGMEEDTMVVFTTDHGDMMGAHRLIEKGPFAYEETWRIPLIAAHPDCDQPGTACDDFVYLHDLCPTFQEEAGVPAPRHEDSTTIRELVLGRKEATGRDSVYGMFEEQIFPFPMRFVRTRTHKLVYNQCDIGELYDLTADPHELVNLIADPKAQTVKSELMSMMAEHMERLQDPLRKPFAAIRSVY